ncbi:MAG: prenyltransferase/squalene oxidase repeat-containing protein [Candidatus Hydrogenedentota bacterium]
MGCRIHLRICVSTLVVVAVLSASSGLASGDESKALEAATRPSPIFAGEPFAETFSFRKAVDYLDNAALDWQQRKQCVSCHTNGLYLASVAEIGPRGKAYESAREFSRNYLKRYVVDNEPPDGDWGAVQGIVSTTALLAISDVKTAGKLDPVTIKAFDYVWARQSEEGCWEEWLKCNWPPFEVDNHFGVTLVAYALGMAPEDYTRTPKAKEGMRKLRKYLGDHTPHNLHQRAMVLLTSTTCDGILGPDEQQEVIVELFSQQKSDGGWNLIEMGGWQRSDGKKRDLVSSDGYATGFATYVLLKAGVRVDDHRIQKAIGWLKANQRVSGRWYTRSPRRDGRHYISNAGTSYAVLALAACGESLANSEN